jgi:hypothetical protein
MSYILRFWVCCNADCQNDFESGEPAPYCPKCDCAKTRWRPSGGHIISPATTHADRTLRSVAASYGLTDLRSAREGESAAPSLPTPKPIPGAPPLTLPGGIQVPRTFTASSSFAAMPQKIPLTRPLDGKAFNKGQGGRIPTNIKAVDPRKLVL